MVKPDLPLALPTEPTAIPSEDVSLPPLESILAMHTGGWIGDMVLLGPALRALRQAYPAAHIALQVRPLVRRLMERHPDLDDVLVWDKSAQEGGARGLWRQRSALRKRRFDAAIIWHPTSIRSAILAWMTGIPVRVGHRIGGRSAFLTAHMPDRPAHETVRYLRVLRLLGIPVDVTASPSTYFWHGPQDREFARAFFSAHDLDDAPVVAVHLGTTWPTKAWEPARFAEVARALSSQGVHILLVGSGTESPLRDAFAWEMHDTPFVDAVGETDLFQLAALIERCNALITPDSGPMHIASAVGTRVIALFGPTSPDRHGPIGAGHVALEAAVPCRPCYSRRCRIEDSYLCMRSIGPDHVLRAAQAALEG